MTDTLTIPQVNSTWTGLGRTATVTEITTMHGRTQVAYNTCRSETGAQGVGMSDLDYFLKHHTEVTQ